MAGFKLTSQTLSLSHACGSSRSKDGSGTIDLQEFVEGPLVLLGSGCLLEFRVWSCCIAL